MQRTDMNEDRGHQPKPLPVLQKFIGFGSEGEERWRVNAADQVGNDITPGSKRHNQVNDEIKRQYPVSDGVTARPQSLHKPFRCSHLIVGHDGLKRSCPAIDTIGQLSWSGTLAARTDPEVARRSWFHLRRHFTRWPPERYLKARLTLAEFDSFCVLYGMVD